jgi:hypothetical protein
VIKIIIHTGLFNRYISKQEIENCIALLHPTYEKLDIEIKCYDKFSTCFKFFIDDSKQAYYDRLTNDIVILPFNIHNISILKQKNKDYIKLCTIFLLFHELRHGYQYKYKKHKFPKKYTRIGSEGYISQWIERDAYRFAVRMMQKNKEEISKILSINNDWNCDYYLKEHDGKDYRNIGILM